MYAERAKANTWKDWKGPKQFDEFMTSYLSLRDEPRFASIFEENLSRDMGMSGSNLKKPARVPARIIRPQGRDSAKHSNAISAITDKITKQISQDLTSSSTASHGESLNITFAQSIKDGMKELKDGMTEMAQYQMETAQYQAMASAPSPMRNEFYSALYNNVMDSMSFKVQKRAMEKQEMAVAKRRLALEDTQLKIAEKNLC